LGVSKVAAAATEEQVKTGDAKTEDAEEEWDDEEYYDDEYGDEGQAEEELKDDEYEDDEYEDDEFEDVGEGEYEEEFEGEYEGEYEEEFEEEEAPAKKGGTSAYSLYPPEKGVRPNLCFAWDTPFLVSQHLNGMVYPTSFQETYQMRGMGAPPWHSIYTLQLMACLAQMWQKAIPHDLCSSNSTVCIRIMLLERAESCFTLNVSIENIVAQHCCMV
jgi:hypothetical protein